MKKLAFLGGVAAIGLIAVAPTPLTQAADHLDGANLLTNPMADLNDVYAWMTTDAGTINLALTVSPADDGTRNFGPTVVYAFHLSSRAGFGMAGKESQVICKFASNTDGECWVTDPMGKTVDYVKGDFSATSGKAAASGKFRVFAGRRSDPFFFNLGGYLRAVGQAETACGGGTPGACPGGVPKDAAGCLSIDGTTAGGLRTLASTAPPAAVGPCAANQIDCFATKNVMSIVIELDKTLVLDGTDKLVTVWASTHAGS